LLRYAVPAWPLLALIAVVTLGASLLAMLEPWPMKVLVDNVLSGRRLDGAVADVVQLLPGEATPRNLLVWVALAGFGFFALGTAMEVVLTDAWVRAGQRMSFGLAADVFASLQRKSIVFHNRTSVGDSMARVLTDSWCVNTLIDALVFKPFYAFLTGAGIVVIMLQLNPGLTGVALLMVPFMAMASIAAGRRIRAASKAKRTAGVRINKHLQQTLTGVSVTQAFAQEDAEHQRFTRLAEQSIRADQKANVVSQLNGLWSGLVATGGAGVILWVGSKSVLAGTFSIGGLLVFIAYLKTLQGKFKAIAGSYVALQNVDASVERVMEALDEPDIPEKPNAKRVQRSKGHVRIEASRSDTTKAAGSCITSHSKRGPEKHSRSQDTPGRARALSYHSSRVWSTRGADESCWTTPT
jgi:ATP-binding cassette subfamily B protein